MRTLGVIENKFSSEPAKLDAVEVKIVSSVTFQRTRAGTMPQNGQQGAKEPLYDVAERGTTQVRPGDSAVLTPGQTHHEE